MIACTLSDAERRKETYTLHLIIMFYAFWDVLKKIYDEWCQVAVVIGVT